MKKEIKRSESGRTMVEMLGTLAIIGVLSIGGVTGYGRAITAHRANTAVETAQREAIIVAGEIATGQKVEPSNATILKSPSGYEVAVRDVTGGTSDIVTTTPFFGVEVGGGNGQAVQRNVAKSIVERAVEDWTNVHGIGVISGEGQGRTIKWLKSAGTGANGFETEVSESAQTVILIIVYASDLAPRTGDLLTEFNVTPIDDAPTTCPTGTSENGSGAEATTLSNGTVCRCDGDGEEYRDGNCVTCQTYETYDSHNYGLPAPEICCGAGEIAICDGGTSGAYGTGGCEHKICCGTGNYYDATNVRFVRGICCPVGTSVRYTGHQDGGPVCCRPGQIVIRDMGIECVDDDGTYPESIIVER